MDQRHPLLYRSQFHRKYTVEISIEPGRITRLRPKRRNVKICRNDSHGQMKEAAEGMSSEDAAVAAGMSAPAGAPGEDGRREAWVVSRVAV